MGENLKLVLRVKLCNQRRSLGSDKKSPVKEVGNNYENWRETIAKVRLYAMGLLRALRIDSQEARKN